jgi:anti-sigma B factor antagonist
VAELRFSMETHGASAVVTVQGELDVTSSQRFDDCLSEAAAASDRVILDMSKVDFMDTTALAVIVAHWRRQADEGGAFLLAGARYRYTKALWITGLADRLPMYDTVSEALAALAGTGSGAASGPGANQPDEPEASAGQPRD